MILSGRERTALRWTVLLLPIIALASPRISWRASSARSLQHSWSMLFLSWLLAFLIEPVVSRYRQPTAVPAARRAGLFFAATVVVAIALLPVIASSVISSLSGIIGTAATFDDAIGIR